MTTSRDEVGAAASGPEDDLAGDDRAGDDRAGDDRAGDDRAGDDRPVLARSVHDGPGPGAPVVVLLHAFPLDRSMWDDVVPLLTGTCRVVAVDLPGLGGSAVPDVAPDLDVAAVAVLAALDDLGASSAVVAGLSTGGYVAALLAGRAPERLLALALLDTTTRLGPPDEAGPRREVAERVLGPEGLDAVMGSVQEGLSERARRERPELAERVAATIRGQRPDGVAWVARALADRRDTTGALRDFPGPVLLLFGEDDAATPPHRRARELHADRPDADLVVVPGSGHLTALEAPHAVADALLRLVRSAGAGGSGA
ncbi:alpha/beta hydrolase [Pseudokineococcus basanitobsidens]|uniref:Alpha/beta hydrolase n=1 Tax=Pseudokineococcus basanitobsidens TaxID=1926649 RepID=A0ABU8RJQ6_9ACTN